METGQIPSSCQEATITPIPKPGKDQSNPTNYRPIALTSCICKTMERMVNDRLVWTLERERLISEYQCGFRRGRSTLDHLPLGVPQGSVLSVTLFSLKINSVANSIPHRCDL